MAQKIYSWLQAPGMTGSGSTAVIAALYMHWVRTRAGPATQRFAIQPTQAQA